MQFSEAIDKLNDGVKVARRTWLGDMFLEKIEDAIKTYMHATFNFGFSTDMFLSKNWIIENDNHIHSSFAVAVEALKQGYRIKLPEWSQKYLMYDKQSKEVVLKSLVVHDWQPIFEDLCADDWEIV